MADKPIKIFSGSKIALVYGCWKKERFDQAKPISEKESTDPEKD